MRTLFKDEELKTNDMKIKANGPFFDNKSSLNKFNCSKTIEINSLIEKPKTSFMGNTRN
jgi:hypothetical protein